MSDTKPIEWLEQREPVTMRLWACTGDRQSQRLATIADLCRACAAAGLPLCDEARDCDERCTNTEHNGVACDVMLSSRKDIYAQQNARIAELKTELRERHIRAHDAELALEQWLAMATNHGESDPESFGMFVADLVEEATAVELTKEHDRWAEAVCDAGFSHQDDHCHAVDFICLEALIASHQAYREAECGDPQCPCYVPGTSPFCEVVEVGKSSPDDFSLEACPDPVVRAGGGPEPPMRSGDDVRRIAHLEAALEQSEAARADLADKLDDAQGNLAWAKRAVELVQSAPVANDDAEGFMLDAVALSARMFAPSPADVMRRDFVEHEGSKS